jgi:hypothetical protein
MASQDTCKEIPAIGMEEVPEERRKRILMTRVSIVCGSSS